MAEASGGVVAFVVQKGRTELERHAVEVRDGGVEPVATVEGEPDVLLVATPDQARELRAGELDLSVAFMRGATKMRGDFGLLLRALPALRDDPSPLLAG